MIYDKVQMGENGWPKEIVSKDGKLKLLFIGWDEPNYGRTLFKVDIIYEEGIITNQVFSKDGAEKWNYIQDKVNKLILSDESFGYYFIPTESSGVIFEKVGGKMTLIPSYHSNPDKKYWRSGFIGNFFHENNLILLYSNQIVIADLLKKDFSYYIGEKDTLIYDSTFENEEIHICFYKVENGERKEFKKRQKDLQFISLDQVNSAKRIARQRRKIYHNLAHALKSDKNEVFCLEIETDFSIAELPTDIFEMVNLSSLKIIDTNISELPSNIERLKNLEVLDLSYNQLKIVHDNIATLTSLKRLNLAYNQLVDLPKSIQEMKGLKKLDLRGNKFDLSFISEIANKLKNCEIIYE